MPFERGRCDECGQPNNCCPECGGTHVSVDTIGDALRFSTRLSPQFARFATEADVGDSVAFALVCWDCGWAEERELVVREHIKEKPEVPA